MWDGYDAEGGGDSAGNGNGDRDAEEDGDEFWAGDRAHTAVGMVVGMGMMAEMLVQMRMGKQMLR